MTLGRSSLWTHWSLRLFLGPGHSGGRGTTSSRKTAPCSRERRAPRWTSASRVHRSPPARLLKNQWRWRCCPRGMRRTERASEYACATFIIYIYDIYIYIYYILYNRIYILLYTIQIKLPVQPVRCEDTGGSSAPHAATCWICLWKARRDCVQHHGTHFIAKRFRSR